MNRLGAVTFVTQNNTKPPQTEHFSMVLKVSIIDSFYCM